MARKKRNRNIFLASLVVVLPLVAVLLAVFALTKGLKHFTATSEYFKIKRVSIEGIQDDAYQRQIRDDLIGTNIFKMDARKLSGRIKRRFSLLDTVSVSRVFPSSVLIFAKERIPVAVFSRRGAYLMDAEGTVLSKAASAGMIDLPLIIGLEHRIKEMKVGTTYASGALHKALRLAKVLKDRQEALRAALGDDSVYRVTKIDVTRPRLLVFYLGRHIQVKVPEKGLEQKIGLLEAILTSMGEEITDVAYIDLRPKEPVVATKK